MKLKDFYKGKNVLVTGHTGFKGSWMCMVLRELGAQVYGYSLEPPTRPSLYKLCGVDRFVTSVIGDVRDYDNLKAFFDKVQPEIVIHMAAQPIVRESYKKPRYTYETNVMGTVNVLEAVRECKSVKTVVNVTTDKVYLNREWERGYVETDELNGFDPYSNSKSCSELVTSSYIKSFFDGEDAPAVSTCRAGNVIGGGDFASDRIIPDCVRAIEQGKDLIVRNPFSTRPYQHVLEPVVAYLTLAMVQHENKSKAGCYNIGPDDKDCLNTGDLVTMFCDKWNSKCGELNGLKWINKHDGGPHEAGFLKLDSSKIKNALDWNPVWGVSEALDKIVSWTVSYEGDGSYVEVMKEQIREYLDKYGR